MLWWGEGRDIGDKFLEVSVFHQRFDEVHLFSQSSIVRYHLLAVRECVLPSPHIEILNESVINRVNLNITSVFKNCAGYFFIRTMSASVYLLSRALD